MVLRKFPIFSLSAKMNIQIPRFPLCCVLSQCHFCTPFKSSIVVLNEGNLTMSKTKKIKKNGTYLISCTCYQYCMQINALHKYLTVTFCSFQHLLLVESKKSVELTMHQYSFHHFSYFKEITGFGTEG